MNRNYKVETSKQIAAEIPIPSIDWLIDRSIDWLIDWSITWSLDRLIDWLIDWLTDPLLDWLIDWLIDFWVLFVLVSVRRRIKADRDECRMETAAGAAELLRIRTVHIDLVQFMNSRRKSEEFLNETIRQEVQRLFEEVRVGFLNLLCKDPFLFNPSFPLCTDCESKNGNGARKDRADVAAEPFRFTGRLSGRNEALA